MNYAKALEIMEAVKQARNPKTSDRRPWYVCDTINHVTSSFKKCVNDDDGTAHLVKQDIALLIDGAFGVPEFLGVETSSANNWGNNEPVVIAFREQMIEDLIAKYKEAANAAV